MFFPDANGNLSDPEAPPPSDHYARRRSRAVLYQLSGHYTKDRRKSKLKINNVSIFNNYYFVFKFNIKFGEVSRCNAMQCYPNF